MKALKLFTLALITAAFCQAAIAQGIGGSNAVVTAQELNEQLSKQLEIFAQARGNSIRGARLEITRNPEGLAAIAPFATDSINIDMVAGQDVAAFFIAPADFNASELPRGFYTLRVTEDANHDPQLEVFDANNTLVRTQPANIDVKLNQADNQDNVSASLELVKATDANNRQQTVDDSMSLHGDCWLTGSGGSIHGECWITPIIEEQ